MSGEEHNAMPFPTIPTCPMTPPTGPTRIVNCPVRVSTVDGPDYYDNALLTGICDFNENGRMLLSGYEQLLSWGDGSVFVGKVVSHGDNSTRVDIKTGTIHHPTKNIVYTGGFNEHRLYHGPGVLFSNNVAYQGTFKRGKCHGAFDVFQFDTSVTFTATFNDGVMTSRGPSMTADGKPLVVLKTHAPGMGSDTGCDSADTDDASTQTTKRQKVVCATNEGIDALGLDVDTTAAVKEVVLKAATTVTNNDPERQLVRSVAETWEATGIECIGKERSDEITMQMTDGSIRRLDMQIAKGDRVGIVEFKADANDFMHGVGQLSGYNRRMCLAVDENGKKGKYAKAFDNGKSVAIVVTPTMPDAFDVETASMMKPKVDAWWPGCDREPI